MRVIYVGVLSAVFIGCGGGQADVQCEQDSNCDLTTGGRCIAAANEMWCAYPDPECPGGYRYSTQSVDDNLSGMCVPDNPDDATLQIALEGPGTVTSSPPGVTCDAASCSGTFPKGTQVRLTATPTAMAFLGWSGACHGIADCTLTLTADTTTTATFGNPGTPLWAVQFGGATGDKGWAVAHDSQDNLIVAGAFTGAVAFGSNTLTSAGGVDIFVVKLSETDGSVIWAKRFGGANEDLVTGLAVDEQDEIFFSGSINGTADYGGGPLTTMGFRDMLLVKLTSAGDFAWAKSFGTSGYDQATAVAARGGKVAVAGYFVNSTINVAGTPIPNQGNNDVLVALFSSTGDLQWARGVGGASDERPETLRIDSAGNVVAAGEFQQTVNFGMGQLTSAGSTDAFVLKLSAAAGATLVQKRYGAADIDTAIALDVDSADAMYVVGGFRQAVDFGTGALTASQSNNSDAYLLKLSAAGATVWAKAYGGSGNGRFASSVAVTVTNDVVFAGGFDGTLSLGGATLSSAGANDVFLARASATDGSYVSSVRAGGPNQESAQSVTQTSDGKYFVTGAFQGLADFGTTTLTSNGGDDAFVYAMAPI